MKKIIPIVMALVLSVGYAQKAMSGVYLWLPLKDGRVIIYQGGKGALDNSRCREASNLYSEGYHDVKKGNILEGVLQVQEAAELCPENSIFEETLNELVNRT